MSARYIIDKIGISHDNLCTCGGIPNVMAITLSDDKTTIVVAFECYNCYPNRVWTKGMPREQFAELYVGQDLRVEPNVTRAKESKATLWKRRLLELWKRISS